MTTKKGKPADEQPQKKPVKKKTLADLKDVVVVPPAPGKPVKKVEQNVDKEHKLSVDLSSDELDLFGTTQVVAGTYVRDSKRIYYVDRKPDVPVLKVSEYVVKSRSIVYPVPAPVSVSEPEIAPIRTVTIGENVFNFTPGVTMIVGQSTFGKTTLLSRLVTPDELVIYGEPRAEALHDPVVVSLRIMDLLTTCDVIAIDSVSTPLYLGPSKLEKGLSAEAFAQLAVIDTYARRANKCFILTFAPMVLETATLELITKSMVNQKITQGIMIPSVGKIEYSDRTSKNRAWRQISWTLEDRVNVINHKTNLLNGTVGVDAQQWIDGIENPDNDSMTHSTVIGDISDANYEKFAESPMTRYRNLAKQLENKTKW